MNLNELAVEITLCEKGSEEMSIAQGKELMKCFLEALAIRSNKDIVNTVNRYRTRIGLEPELGLD